MAEIWPGRFLSIIKQRDRARATAVRLEQELARLEDNVEALATDLMKMHADQAIDLQQWPTAKTLVDACVLGRVKP